MADDLDPAAVITAEEARIRGYVDFDEHRDQAVGEINGMRRALRLLAAAGLLVTPGHDAQVAARAWDEGKRHESEYLATWGQFCPHANCNPYRQESTR